LRDRYFFILGFAKNEREAIELERLKETGALEEMEL
jgi:hypothetical protein